MNPREGLKAPLPTKLYLLDLSKDLVASWEEAFEGFEDVEVICGDIFSKSSDAIVSPANSFGIMDGGIDLILRNKLGYGTENRLQDAIVEHFHGELPVGSALVVETKTPPWKYLIAAPTMRIPERVAHTLNAYHAFRAVLLAIKAHNASASDKNQIHSISCPGLATGIGGMNPRTCAGQMRMAYNALDAKPRIHSFELIHKTHRVLKSIL